MTEAPGPAAERSAVLEEWKRRQAEWKPQDKHSVGCVMMLASAVLLFVFPAVGRALVPEKARPILAALAVVLGIAGFLVMQIRRIPYDPKKLIEESIAILNRADANIESRRRGAVVLLFHYLDVRGPTMSSNFNAGEVRGRLSAAALDYVQSVEAILRDEIKLGPVFLPPPPPQEPV